MLGVTMLFELAKQIRAEDPRMHKLSVATEIANRWKRNTEPWPSTGHLIRALRQSKTVSLRYELVSSKAMIA